MSSVYILADCCKDPDTPGIRNSYFKNSHRREEKFCHKVNGLKTAEDEALEHVLVSWL